jgi:DHA2 family multidrug resistance protein
MLQGLYGYPVSAAGYLLMPRGAGAMLAMFVAGRFVGVLDRRILILGGLSINAVSLWQMQQFDLTMGGGAFMVTGLTQGFGLGVMMAPVTTYAFSALPVEMRAEASSLFAILRNMGSSVGISLMQAPLTRHAQTMHASLSARIDPSDPVVRSALGAMFDPASAQGALALNGEIDRQALMVGYLNDFKLMFFLALGCMLLVLVVPNPKRAQGALVARSA